MHFISIYAVAFFNSTWLYYQKKNTSVVCDWLNCTAWARLRCVASWCGHPLFHLGVVSLYCRHIQVSAAWQRVKSVVIKVSEILHAGKLIKWRVVVCGMTTGKAYRKQCDLGCTLALCATVLIVIIKQETQWILCWYFSKNLPESLKTLGCDWHLSAVIPLCAVTLGKEALEGWCQFHSSPAGISKSKT